MDGSESHRIAAPAAPAPRRARPAGRRVAIAAAVWLVLVAGALGIAAALDQTPETPPPAPVSVAPEGLPLLRLYLDRELPADVARLDTLADQVTRLQELATTRSDPARWVELGAIAQRAGDLVAAESAFAQAVAIDPDRLDVAVGRAMNDGATGPEGLARADAALRRLAAANPRSQLVWFNLGMVGVYRADRATIEQGLSRAQALGPQTTLGALARRFGSAAPGTP